jgi:TrmH family RNA methyltransferase
VKLLTLARDLKRRKARERQSLFVAEGVRAVEELLDSPIELRGVLTSSELPSSSRGAMLLEQLQQRRGLDLLEVNESDFASAADTDAPQGVLAIAAVPDRSLEQIPSDGAMRLLVLDAVQDPGNVGTILRTAAAFGATATIALPGTVDLWNAKVVRSAMGALFHHLALSSTWEALDAFLSARDVGVWGADAAGATVDSIATSPERLALIVGNEGAGLSAAARARATKIVSLPISPAVESLNVAVAAGVLLYELRPARSRPS